MVPSMEPGYFSWQPTKIGTYFIKCPMMQHCILGMQLTVVVSGR